LARRLRQGLVGQDARWVAAAVVFAASYLALAVGRVPGLAIDRAGVALVGACLMVAGGALPLADAYRAVDLDTLTLLLGMMIVVANLRLSGFFTQASGWVMRRAHYPLALLAAVTAVAGVFSAFLVNDAICLVLAPLVLELTLSLRRNPVPRRTPRARPVTRSCPPKPWRRRMLVTGTPDQNLVQI
jgi:Na+/H+ antiporter NhaD/arsenite permease-like protein